MHFPKIAYVFVVILNLIILAFKQKNNHQLDFKFKTNNFLIFEKIQDTIILKDVFFKNNFSNNLKPYSKDSNSLLLLSYCKPENILFSRLKSECNYSKKNINLKVSFDSKSLSNGIYKFEFFSENIIDSIYQYNFLSDSNNLKIESTNSLITNKNYIDSKSFGSDSIKEITNQNSTIRNALIKIEGIQDDTTTIKFIVNNLNEEIVRGSFRGSLN